MTNWLASKWLQWPLMMMTLYISWIFLVLSPLCPRKGPFLSKIVPSGGGRYWLVLLSLLWWLTKILRVEPKLWKLCSLDQSRVLLESSALRSFCFPAQTNLFWTLRCLRHGFWLKIRFRPSPLNYYQNSDERPGQQRELLGQFHGGTCWFLQFYGLADLLFLK